MLRFFLIFTLFCTSCKPQNTTNLKAATAFSIGNNGSYDFSTPQEFHLSASLEEISGLSYANGKLYTHNDEDGKLFELNAKNGKIISEHNFGQNDDYEGIEIVNNEMIITNSKGNLLFYNLATAETKTIKTEFKSQNNIEGLAYDAKKGDLLIACKGQMLKEDNKKNKAKGVYRFNLKTEKLTTDPFLVIKDKDLKKYLEKKQPDNAISEENLEALLDRALDFSPSGIAIHPETKDYYITSARGKSLVIVNSKEKIKGIVFLNEEQLPQPEGICFDTEGNLYLSTEGGMFDGKIYKYTINRY